MKNKVTIFTPTYNRKYVLERCYSSLLKQSDDRFIWLVVDDGSTDGTQELIEKWKKDNLIDITYIKQKNQGKHIAHNTAVINCETEIFFCLDSDDYIIENAVELILNYWSNIRNCSDIAGIIALRGKNYNTPLGTFMPKGIKETSISHLYEKYRFKGDTALVFKTEVIKEYLFPQIKNEKFMTEAVIYEQISKKYKMKLLNRVIYIGEYLEDGYSKNLLKIQRENPRGYLYYLNQKINLSESYLERKKSIAEYVVGCIRLKKFKGLKVINILDIVFVTPLVIYRLIKIKLKRIFIKLSINEV